MSEHHHNHQKAGEGGPILGGVGPICACQMSASCDCVSLAMQICGSKEETEFLLTDRKRHAQTLLSLLASSPGVTGCHQLWQLARSCRVTSCSLQWCGCAALLRCGDLGLSVMLCFFALRLMPALQHSLLACITCLTFLPDTLHQGQVPPSTTKVVEFFCFFFLPVNRSVILESATPSRVSTLCSLVLHYECPNTFSGVSAVRPARSPQRPPSMGCNASTLIKAQPHLHVTCSCSNQEVWAASLLMFDSNMPPASLMAAACR